MAVVSLVLEVRLDGCMTSKQRSKEAESILSKLRRHFNVSVSDLNASASGDVAALGFATVAKTRREGREVLERVADAVAAHPRAEIVKALFDDR